MRRFQADNGAEGSRNTDTATSIASQSDGDQAGAYGVRTAGRASAGIVVRIMRVRGGSIVKVGSGSV